MAETLHITWYPPLEAALGRTAEVPLDGPIAVGDLLHRLCDEKPRLKKFVRFDANDGTAIGLMVLIGDTLLKASDTVAPGGAIDVLVAIDGG